MAVDALHRFRTGKGLQLSMTAEEALEGYLMVTPVVVGLLVFSLGAILASLYLGLTTWDLFGAPQFVGLANYQKLLKDELFYKSVRNTAYYAAIVVPVGTVLALALAILMNQRIRGVNLFRTVFFLPSVCSEVAIAVIWVWLYAPEFGLFDMILRAAGIPAPRWLSSTKWAMPSVTIMAIWQGLGYNMVIFLAGLQGIPQEYYEAAAIDGAGRQQSFRHITMPLLSPMTFFVIIMYTIGAFQVFASVFIMTMGGPYNATLTIAYYLYRSGFEWFKMGYASALAYVLFFIIVSITLLQFRLQRQWVYYES